MKQHRNIDQNDVGLLKKRRMIFFLSICLIALAWYAVTGFESSNMGFHPFVRRPFTWFDWLFYAAIIATAIMAYMWYKKCPKCGGKMNTGGIPLQCQNCGFGSDSNPPQE